MKLEPCPFCGADVTKIADVPLVIDVDCGYFDEEYGRFEWFHSQNVTAWMPLPEPYKEVE